LTRGGRASDSKRKKSDRIPEEAAVLAIISQGDRYGLKFGDRLSHPGDLWLKPVAPLQVTAVLAGRFVARITRDGLEGAIRVDEPQRRIIGVRNEHSLVNLLNHRTNGIG
jgi:hypothetical protein